VSAPRITPGTRREIGLINAAIAGVVGRAAGGGPPNLFTTLGRHRGLMRGWLSFARRLMPGGLLPRQDSELVILRVAHNTGCEYERRHHVGLARRAGLSDDEIERTTADPEQAGWSPRRAALLCAADELHRDGVLGDAAWEDLAAHLDERRLIELLMLVGHYEMLAMTLNTLRVQPDRPNERGPSFLMRLGESRR
jgi:AhpD family alkylhydroperoxidase